MPWWTGCGPGWTRACAAEPARSGSVAGQVQPAGQHRPRLLHAPPALGGDDLAGGDVAQPAAHGGEDLRLVAAAQLGGLGRQAVPRLAAGGVLAEQSPV